MQSFRQTLRSVICARLEPLDACLALSEGGSAAFGRDDELSDLDFGAVVTDGATREVADAVVSAIESVAVIERAHELPQPTWHGGWQTFYRLKDHPMTLVDFCITEKSQDWTLNEVERHGRPVVHFDKVGAVTTSALDMEKTQTEIRIKAAKMEAMVNMFHDFVDKEVKRGRLIDAMHFYVRMVLYPLVDALRMKHDPARHDFSARYLYFDLPDAVAKEVEVLFLVKDAVDLLEKKARAVELFNQAIEPFLSPQQ